ncbi:hypothetical protein CLV71_101606 [Actinophytocola oryzae]|uniref:UGSC-like domain-containing protein n=1 Tax=Actinophytocola oryzae TaxID=502181 RepID=A0A4R7W4T5_9PSEU|nr:hypothetical protein [Actinophytocola oryzae]TDV57733.1 hypothetical protein CLV71_101606 [Actinophytocola oryzae]
MELETLGVPGVVMCSRPFASLAGKVAGSLGLPDVRMVVVPHPFGSVPRDELLQREVPDQVLADVLALLGTP